MITQSDVTLAQFSAAAYGNAAALPPGFGAAPLALDPGSYAGGEYMAGHGAALAATGLLDGKETLVIAFRGSDDRADSLDDLTGINAAYADFAPLVAAADAYAATGAVQQVVVTGHSLGGAMAQLYMASHPDQPGGVPHLADTFGSPGAQQAPAADPRVENIVIADDPAVFLGTHRGEIGATLRADPALAQAAANRASGVFPGLTADDALQALPSLTANYVNHGTLALLPGADGSLGPASPGGLLQADPARHDVALYVAETARAAAGTEPSLLVADPAATPQDAYYRAVYAGEYPPGADPSGVLGQVLHGWVDGNAALHDAGIDTGQGSLLGWANTEFHLF